MLDIIQSLTGNIGISNTGSSRNCKCNLGGNSQSNIFEMVLINLLNAMNQQNKNTRKILESDPSQNTTSNFNDINFNNVNLNISNMDIDQRIESAIENSSKKYGVDEKLIKAIIKQESNFNPNAVSSAGAQGLMQLMPENCTALGVSDPLNIEQNIDGGVRHIKGYLDRYNGNVEMALMAYNGGPTRMINRGVTSINHIYKMPKETQNYVPKVLNYYRGL